MAFSTQRVCGTFLLAIIVACISTRVATADTIKIDTIGPDGLPNVIVGSFGEPNAATGGQTFIAPPHARRLDRFTFYLFYVEGGPTRFAGYVGGWDGEKASGPLLYQSGERQVMTPLVAVPVTFETGGIPVTPGRRYVAFLSASPFFDGVDDNTNLFLEADTYAGGGHVALGNGSNFGEIFTRSWGGLQPLDLAFTAEFSTVPEPSTMILLGTGVAALAASRARRKRTGSRS